MLLIDFGRELGLPLRGLYAGQHFGWTTDRAKAETIERRGRTSRGRPIARRSTRGAALRRMGDFIPGRRGAVHGAGRMSEPAELDHALRHLLQAREAIRSGEPCAARAHLREAQADIRWTLKPVTKACAEYATVSYKRDDERCTATTAAGTRCLGWRYEDGDLCFIHQASQAGQRG